MQYVLIIFISHLLFLILPNSSHSFPFLPFFPVSPLSSHSLQFLPFPPIPPIPPDSLQSSHFLPLSHFLYHLFFFPTRPVPTSMSIKNIYASDSTLEEKWLLLLRSHELHTNSSLARVGASDSLPHPCRHPDRLNLMQVCSDNHNCCEFMNTMAMWPWCVQ